MKINENMMLEATSTLDTILKYTILPIIFAALVIDIAQSNPYATHGYWFLWRSGCVPSPPANASIKCQKHSWNSKLVCRDQIVWEIKSFFLASARWWIPSTYCLPGLHDWLSYPSKNARLFPTSMRNFRRHSQALKEVASDCNGSPTYYIRMATFSHGLFPRIKRLLTPRIQGANCRLGLLCEWSKCKSDSWGDLPSVALPTARHEDWTERGGGGLATRDVWLMTMRSIFIYSWKFS